jgi:hypothetical protein
MNFVLCVTYLVHIFIWVFVLWSPFLSKRAAKFSIYYAIPAIYVIHAVLPFHILEKIKLDAVNNNIEKKEYDQTLIDNALVIPSLVIKLQKFCDTYCTFSPLSPQGMLLFGMIGGLLKVYPHSYFKKGQ